MYTNRKDRFGASCLNFLSMIGKKDTNTILLDLMNKEINCSFDTLKDFSKEVKQLFIDKLKSGMESEDYFNYESTLIRLDNNLLENFQTIILEILKMDKDELVSKLTSVSEKHNFNCLQYRKEVIKEDQSKEYRIENIPVTAGISFTMLREIYMESISFSKKYVSNLLNDGTSLEDLKTIYDDIKNNEDSNYKTILLTKFSEKMSYVKDIEIFNKMYNTMYDECVKEFTNNIQWKYDNSKKKEIIKKQALAGRSDLYSVGAVAKHGYFKSKNYGAKYGK